MLNFVPHSLLTSLSTEPGELPVQLGGFNCMIHACLPIIRPSLHFPGECYNDEFTISLQPTKFWTRCLM